MTAAEDAVERALWERASERPHDDAAHGAYLEHCARSGMLPTAARRYRAARDALAEDDAARARCDKRLGAITLLALRHIDAQRGEREPPARRGKLVLALLAILVVAVLGAMMVSALARA